MEELLRQINETFDNCIANSNGDTVLQLKIIKGNVNTLFKEYSDGTLAIPIFEKKLLENNIEMQNSNVGSVISDNAKKILIVDDSSIVRNYLQKIFSDKYQIDIATDGQDAINILSEIDNIENLSLILLDLMMPNIDGFGVLEYLSGKNIKIPVVIISGDNTKETVNRAFSYNVADMIEKPFDAKNIQSKIESIIEK